MMMMFSNQNSSNPMPNLNVQAQNAMMMMGSANSPTNGNLMQQLTNMNTINNSNLSNNSDEHEELLAEMELIERMPTQERLKQAKRRRALQLKKWLDYERELEAISTTSSAQSPAIVNVHFEKSSLAKRQYLQQQQYMQNNTNVNSNGGGKVHQNFTMNNQYRRSIKFQDHIVLLDAIMRKDYDEIERLLDSGVTPNSANEDGLTAIHQVAGYIIFD